MCDIHKGTRETERENYSSEIEIYEEKNSIFLLVVNNRIYILFLVDFRCSTSDDT